MERDFHKLPEGLPVPVDDGAAGHLEGREFPAVSLDSTAGGQADLPQVFGERAVLFIYPRTGVPGEPLLPGWDSIPGARGCTPQSCSYRDRFSGFSSESVSVFGMSAQTAPAHAEFKARESIPFDIFSDPGMKLASLLELPTFEISDLTLYRRLTMVIGNGRIEKVFYPVFPPDEDASNVLAWLMDTP